MFDYSITYFAPYTFANFKCRAASAADGRRQRDEFNDENGFMIMNREIKVEKFNKRKI